ncbi:tricarboxylate transporter [Cereibacter changlensis]|jgi:tripartite-type tricarboxylate transporter receptor subunit TctC|uniref:Tricarboxylate transporter n=1 Tax=Cereibacter changlensis TaxID=402884 RepID=A0A4V5NL91_9RHOB|nr:tricarboxylate transporter [Cereibacter changlensis]MBZ4690824.1 twin-arginine translocation signal protein [Cereibacter sp.]TKA94777.1 tricarboxylate transporter [Cereibacter changlensis]
MTQTRRTFLTAALIGALWMPGVASAQEVDFTGKQIEWVIPLSEGGGTDVWARFLAPYLSRYLPGEPAVFIRNVPGGGSITGTNQFVARPRLDGTSLIGTTGSTALPMLLGDTRVNYDFNRDLTPLLVSPSGGVVYLPPSFGVTSIEDLKSLGDKELVYGSQGPTGLDIIPMLGFELLGLNVRHVFGMTGRGDGRLAFLRGEATIDYQTTSAYLANVVPMIEEGTAVPIFSWGVLNSEGKIVRDPTFPDLPSFAEAYEVVHGKPPEGLAFEAFLALFGAGMSASKPAMLPIDTPQPIVDAYREAFAKALQDPELVARSGEILGEYEQGIGDNLAGMFRVATTISPEAREWAQNYLSERYQIEF